MNRCPRCGKFIWFWQPIWYYSSSKGPVYRAFLLLRKNKYVYPRGLKWFQEKWFQEKWFQELQFVHGAKTA